MTKPYIDIAGDKWNDPGTFYRFPPKGKQKWKIVSGDDVDDKKIPEKTIVFFRKWGYNGDK